MAWQEKFTAGEWQTLLFAPLWVFSGIALADGKIDQKEIEAFSAEVSDAPLYKDDLVREVMLALAGGFPDVMTAYQADSRKIDIGLGEVADLLEAKAADHADNFKRVLLAIAAKVANASGSAIGGKVSDEEKNAFVIIALSLRAKLS